MCTRTQRMTEEDLAAGDGEDGHKLQTEGAKSAKESKKGVEAYDRNAVGY